jgi:hypothetical protein
MLAGLHKSAILTFNKTGLLQSLEKSGHQLRGPEMIEYLEIPITGFGGCCARVTSGNAAAVPPSTDINSRLPISIAIWPLARRGQSALEHEKDSTA